uniref:Uncharacterized protein n=1 Tax=Rhizophora mucronata TaxID=61149 RepID=A0A2P2JSR6_RHIMU
MRDPKAKTLTHTTRAAQNGADDKHQYLFTSAETPFPPFFPILYLKKESKQ